MENQWTKKSGYVTGAYWAVKKKSRRTWGKKNERKGCLSKPIGLKIRDSKKSYGQG